ncbi:ribose 5-phosphate isomerase B [Pelagibius sp.]|uniref:ribose 5-phosphate isomerase B n=1 Tax=Pelagibius sp. TaxID=1931238 RepID=UPI003BAFDFD9
MAKKSIAIAADHAGFDLKSKLVEDLKASGYDVQDLGTNDATTSVDYPDFGRAVAEAVTSGKAERGVVVCGTGIGISIAANRHAGVRAALCHDETSARLCREHNDANVLALGARLIGEVVAKDCVRTFLNTEYAGERHARRVAKLG